MLKNKHYEGMVREYLMDTLIGWVLAPLHQPKPRYSLEKLEWEQMSKNDFFTIQDSATSPFLWYSFFHLLRTECRTQLCSPWKSACFCHSTGYTALLSPQVGSSFGSGTLCPLPLYSSIMWGTPKGLNKHLLNQGMRLIHCSFHKSWLRSFTGDIAPCRTIIREPMY